MKTRPGSLIHISSTIRIVEVALQRSEPSYRVEHRAHCAASVENRRERTAQRALVVVGDDFLDQQPYARAVGSRIEAAPTNQLSDLVLDNVDGVHDSPWNATDARHSPWSGKCVEQ